MPNSIRTKRKRAPKIRTKTFTGCWTCRSRRVKCDDEKPQCQRCRRSGWQCQGYGMRLGWSETPGNRVQRRQLCMSTQQTHELSSTGVTALLAELDGCSADGSAQRGPFSVFSVTTSEPNDTHPVAELSGLLQNSSSAPDRGRTQICSSDGLNGTDEPLPENVPGGTSQASTSSRASSIETWSSALPYEGSGQIDHVPNISTAPIRIRQQCPPNTDANHSAGFTENSPSTLEVANHISNINPLPLPRPETELVHHWVIFLSGNMMLIDTPDNPCRTIFMPLALKGLESSPADSNIHLSIFHAICASSAFSLFHLRRDSRYQSLAMHHDQLALGHLRGNLLKAKRLDEPTLAAVLSCITAEAMSGRRTRWRAHVAGGLGLLENEIHGGWIRGPTASRLLQSYLSLSSLCSLPMSTQLISLLNAPSEVRHYLERSHGITAPIVQFLARITIIIESKSEISAEELDQLELQLYLNFPCVSTPGASGSIIIQHALNSFYYASILFFRRTLRCVPVRDVQDLVEKAVDELEAVDALTRGKGGCAYNWSGFVVAAECERHDLQQRMLCWFDRKSGNGIQNINILCEIVKALWHRRQEAGLDSDIQWQELAKEKDFDIMLV